jgi:hypothetical protein
MGTGAAGVGLSTEVEGALAHREALEPLVMGFVVTDLGCSGRGRGGTAEVGARAGSGEDAAADVAGAVAHRDRLLMKLVYVQQGRTMSDEVMKR